MTEAALGKIEAAERSFRETLELDKTLIGARLGLARVVSQSGRRDEAKSELEKILASYPAGSVSAPTISKRTKVRKTVRAKMRMGWISRRKTGRFRL